MQPRQHLHRETCQSLAEGGHAASQNFPEPHEEVSALKVAIQKCEENNDLVEFEHEF